MQCVSGIQGVSWHQANQVEIAIRNDQLRYE